VAGDTYVWGGSIAGSWTLSSNWDDTTTNQNPAALAPGVANAVTIGAAANGQTTVITGNGYSASLTIDGSTLLGGQFETGSLTASGSATALDLNTGDTLTVSGAASIEAATLDGGSLEVGGALSTNGYESIAIDNGGVLTAGSLSTSYASYLVGSDGILSIKGNVSDAYGTSIDAQGGELAVLGTFTTNDSYIYASSGGVAQLAGLTAGSSYGSVDLSADSASSIEIGSSGGTAVGAITVDSGVTTTDDGSFSAPSIVDEGTIAVVASQSLSLQGALSGGGQVRIGAGSSLQVTDAAASSATNTIDFTGAGTLTLDPTDLNATGAFAPVISGFNSDGVIDYQGTVTTAVYSNGVLTLLNGAVAVAKLSLTGNFNGESFVAIPVAYGATQISVRSGGDTGSPPAGTATANSYLWGGLIAGSWDLASNWDDTTANQNPAALAPGVADAVTTGTAGGATTLITGTGDSASLTIDGSTLLGGQFATGSLTANAALELDTGDTLTVSGAASLEAATLDGGSLEVGGTLSTSGYESITIDDGGVLTAGSLSTSYDSYLIGSGGSLSIGGNVTDASATPFNVQGGDFTVGGTINDAYINALRGGVAQLAGPISGSAALSADSTSSIELGSSGGAAIGTITVDSGVARTLSGSISAPSIVDKGTIAVAGALNLKGALTGGGLVQLGAGGSLQITGAGASASSDTIDFTGAGTLTLGGTDLNPSGAFAPVIAGFNANAVIDYRGTVTSASFSNGVLTLLDGAVAVGKLTLSGSFSGDSFVAIPVASGTTQISILGGGDAGAPPAGTTTANSYLWNGAIAGSWDLASNWDDTTTNQKSAALAPGVKDAVTIKAAAGGGTTVITGMGDSASLTIDGSTLLGGQFATGSLAANASLALGEGDALAVSGAASIEAVTLDGGSLEVGGTLSANGYVSIAIDNGGVLTAGSLSTSDVSYLVGSGGNLSIQGNISDANSGSFDVQGADFEVGGTFTSNNSYIGSYSGGVVQLAGLTAGSSYGSVGLSVDGASSIEIGSSGGAAVGAITVDSGVITTEDGSFSAPSIVDEGTIAVVAGQSLSLQGALSGVGQIQIGAGSSLQVTDAASFASSNTIAFAGAGTLTLDPTDLNGSGAFAPVIAGFNPEGVIDYQGTVTSAFYSNGVLTLLDGAVPVGELSLTGNFTGETFSTTPVAGGQTQINLTAGASTVAITDTASDISNNLDGLNADPNISSITISDNGQIVASVAQLTSDATTIGKLQDANGSPVQLAIDDTAGDIKTGLATLVADASEIASITPFAGSVAVSTATFLADRSALDKIVGGFAISDSAADVAAQFNTLNGDVEVTSIALTNGGTPALTLSVAQALNDTRALAEITPPFTITVVDNTADILAQLGALAGDSEVTSIILTNGGTPALTLRVCPETSCGIA